VYVGYFGARRVTWTLEGVVGIKDLSKAHRGLTGIEFALYQLYHISHGWSVE